MSERVTRTTVDNVTKTPILSPIECNTFSLYSEGEHELYLWVDSADDNTKKKLLVDSQEAISAPSADLRKRYKVGDVLRYAQRVDVGTDVVVLTVV